MINTESFSPRRRTKNSIFWKLGLVYLLPLLLIPAAFDFYTVHRLKKGIPGGGV